MVYDLTYRDAFSCQHFFLSSQLDQKAVLDFFRCLTELPPKALWLSVTPFFVFCSSVLFCFVSYFSCRSVLVSLRSFSARLSAAAFLAFLILTGFLASSLRETVVLPQPPKCCHHRHELLCWLHFSVSQGPQIVLWHQESHSLYVFFLPEFYVMNSQNFTSWM